MTAPAFHLNSPLVVRSPNWLGDAVMALPAVRNLKTLVVREPLTVATPAKLAALWEACPFVDRVLALEDPRNIWTTSHQLRDGKFASALLLPNSLRAAGEAGMAGIPQRIGYGKGGRSLLLNHAVPKPPRNPLRLHQRYYYIDLAAAVGAPSDDSLPVLRREAPPSGSEARPVIAICPGAEYGPAKRWPVENFAAVARHFVEKRQAHIVLLGAPVDMPVANDFLRAFPDAENRVGKTTLAEFMAALGSANLVFCNDSGAMHVASALGTPTVVIFGSTEPQLTGPMGLHTAVLRHHVPCSPCFLRECPIDFGCMTSVSPVMAIAAGEKLLSAR